MMVIMMVVVISGGCYDVDGYDDGVDGDYDHGGYVDACDYDDDDDNGAASFCTLLMASFYVWTEHLRKQHYYQQVPGAH